MRMSVGFAGLVEASNTTGLPPTKLTAGAIETGGDHPLLSGGTCRTVGMSFVAITPGQYEIRIRGTTGEMQRAAVAIR